MTTSASDIKDRRREHVNEPISAELITEANVQLENEISLIEGWLSDLQETRDDNSESILAKKTYDDMLLNRKELLAALKQQS